MHLSIIVPSYDASDYVAPCLRALVEQETPYSYEIIVVDSTGDSSMAEACTQHAEHIDLIELPSRAFPGEARNLGLARAKGAIIAFVDTKMICPPDWVTRMVEMFDDLERQAVAGPRKVAPGTGLAGMTQFYAEFFDFSLLQTPRLLKFVPGGNTAFRRNLLGVDPFHSSLRRSEDTLFFGQKIGQLVMYPSLACQYICARSWREAFAHLLGLGSWSGYVRYHFPIKGHFVARSIIGGVLLFPYRCVRFLKFAWQHRRHRDVVKVTPMVLGLLAVWTVGFVTASVKEAWRSLIGIRSQETALADVRSSERIP